MIRLICKHAFILNLLPFALFRTGGQQKTRKVEECNGKKKNKR